MKILAAYVLSYLRFLKICAETLPRNPFPVFMITKTLQTISEHAERIDQFYCCKAPKKFNIFKYLL
jgi:hypothetical protein